MKKIIMMFFLTIFTISIFVCNSYGRDLIKQWDASLMPDGEIESFDGLEMLAGSSKMKIKSSPKNYDNVLKFDKAINTGGASSIYTSENMKYVGKSRVIKLSVNQACRLKVYAFTASSDAYKPKIKVSRKGEIMYEGDLASSVSLFTTGLIQNDTYYIYCLEGSMGISRIELEEIEKGDINFDGVFNNDDIIYMTKFLNKEISENGAIKYYADFNSDGIIDKNDMEKQKEIYKDKYGYEPDIYSEKIWNISDFSTGNFLSYDGLYAIKENELSVNGTNISYENKYFSKCLKTNGGAAVNRNGLPIDRALKFYTSSSCKLILYAKSGSNSATNPIAFVVGADGYKKQINIENGKIEKFEFNLPKSDVYYIFSSNNSGCMDIYYIELKKCPQGDINGNFSFDYEDLKLVTEFLKGNIQLSIEQEKLADVNDDGKISEIDRGLILNLIKNNYNSKSFSAKQWKAENMPLGNIYEYDGLELVPAPQANDIQNRVEECERSYDYIKYNKALLLHGSGNITKRAIKINTDKPTLLTIYAYNRSNSSSENYIEISNGLNTVESFNFNIQTSSSVKKFQSYLSQPATYYIYSGGTIGVCEISLMTVRKGDLDSDGVISYKDYSFLEDYLSDNNENNLLAWQLIFADIDDNGVIDNNDLIALKSLAETESGLNSFTDKVWNMTEITQSLSDTGLYSVKEDMTIDGLTFYSANKNEKPYFGESSKSHGNLSFLYAYNTAGISQEHERGIAFDTSGDCTLTLLVRTATGTTSKQTININRNNKIVKTVDLLNSWGLDNGGVQEIKVYLDKAGRYSISSPEGAFRVYYIGLSSTENIKDISNEKILNVYQDTTIREFFIVNDLPYEKGTTYQINYDSSVLELTEIGFGEKNQVNGNIKLSDDIEIVSKNQGLIIFKVSGEEINYTGITAPVTFKAKISGMTTIKYSINYKE